MRGLARFFQTEISVSAAWPLTKRPSGLKILPHIDTSASAQFNTGMNSGGRDGIVSHCLLYFAHQAYFGRGLKPVKLLVYVRIVVATILDFMTEEDWGE